MKTTMDLFDDLVKEVKRAVSTLDFVFPQKGTEKLRVPEVYEFYLPPPNTSQEETFPYIVVCILDEDQKMGEEADCAVVTFALVVGVYQNSKDFSLGPRDLHIAMERLAVYLKNRPVLGQAGELQRISKKIAEKHPVPYFEGQITITYSYYKPVQLPEG